MAGILFAGRGTIMGLRVFIIDEDHLCRRTTVQKLNQWGHDSTGFESISAVIGCLKQKQRCDFFICDLREPLLDGFRLLRFLQEQNLSIPVILMNTGWSCALKQQAIKNGAYAMLTKPFPFDELFQLTKRLQCGIGTKCD